jgi:hypothetical protein
MKQEQLKTEELIKVRDLVRTPFNYHFVVDLPDEYSVSEAREIKAKFEAAPDMYEALKKAKETIEMLASELNYQSPRWVSEHLTPIEAALDKATY